MATSFEERRDHLLRGIREPKVYTIRVPRHSEWRPALAYSFMSRLVHLEQIIFEISAINGVVRWRIVDIGTYLGGDNVDLAETLAVPDGIRAAYPQAEVVEGGLAGLEPEFPFHRITFPIHQKAEFFAPILYPRDLKDHDPLTLIVNGMDHLLPGENMVYWLYVRKHDPQANEQGQKEITNSPLFQIAMAGLGGMLRTNIDIPREKYVDELQKPFQEKLRDALYRAHLLFQVDARSQERLFSPAVGVEMAFREFSEYYQYLASFDDSIRVTEVTSSQENWDSSLRGILSRWMTGEDTSFQKTENIFNFSELATLWHLPHEHFTARGIEWSRGIHIPIPVGLKGAEGDVCIGDNEFLGRREPVNMLNQDRIEHMTIIGRTGVGKSTFIHNMVRQDIEQGRGVAVIDPDGNLVKAIMQSSIPPERFNDVVIWDLADTEYPPPLNPLAVSTDRQRESAASYIQTVFERIFEDDMSARRMGGTLNMALQTIMVDEGATLRDVIRVLRDTDYRWDLLENMDDFTREMVDKLWEPFDAARTPEQNQMTMPIEWRVQSLIRDPLLYSIICHPDNFDLHDYMANNRIVLISLRPPEEHVLDPHAQRFLGAIWIGKFYLAARAKAAKQPFFLYVDEAQDFVTADLPNILTRARKDNLGMILANQFLDQLKGKTLEAIIGNVSSRIVLASGETDAKKVIAHFKEAFTSDDLVNLDNYQAAVSMHRSGKKMSPFTLQVSNLGDFKNPTVEMAQAEEAVRQTFASRHQPKSREAVLETLRHRYPLRPASRCRAARSIRRCGGLARLTPGAFRNIILLIVAFLVMTHEGMVVSCLLRPSSFHQKGVIII